MYISGKVLFCLKLTIICFMLETTFARVKKSNVKVKEKVCLFQYMHCEYNLDYFSIFTCQKSSGNTTVNLKYTLRNDLDNDIWIDFKVLSLNRRTSSWTKFFAFDVNLCDTVSPNWTRKFNILNVWIINTLKYGNFTQTCPIRAGNYSYLNIKAEKASIGPLNGIYRIDSLLYKRLENTSRDILLKQSFAFDIRMK